ncbi:MAG: Na+/H+ antiporter NhaA [Bacteroidales bacterium]|nr:Na+/H+ antiporter NhaA [Bacteroidales bacterium]MCF8455791.1 Na+/H+ antiporter NhaA [Bacteroidales bacterium]
MTQNTILSPVQKFIKTESLSGLLLFLATVLALILANSSAGSFYESIWQYRIGISSENFSLVKPIILWINDGLMAIFFFLIGLEIKREVLIGELNTMKKASLPIFAAIGGMVLPLLMFLMLNSNPDTTKAWGISMATDIAFTLAILQVLGKRVPLGLKIFLTAFAIIDDIGAVLVIALFYTGNIEWNLLLYAGILLAILYGLSYFKIHLKFILLIFGFVVWLLFLKAGIHPTIAGIMLAFAVPIHQRINEFTYSEKLQDIVTRITASINTNKLPILSKNQIEEIDNLEDWTNKVQSPLQQLEHRLHYWVAYFIIPVFAFSNAGVSFNQQMGIDYNLAINIALSLFLGKMIGVTIFSFLSVKLKLASLPEKVNFTQIIGVAILSGLGFTMSLFIANLAFIDSSVYLNSAKTGIIIGSVVSGILGYLVLRIGIKSTSKKTMK